MTPARCSRNWEVEALRDGRVGEGARADLERHVARCPSCSEERSSLAALAQRLRAEAPGEADDLALRRLRGRVLESADTARLVPSQRPPAMRSPAVRAFVFAAAVCVSFFVAWRLVRVEPQMQTQVTTTDEGGARWSTYDEGKLRRIDLLEGTLALRIDRPASGKRVVVRVPDGEIEDTGTTFRVAVKDGRTSAVEVDDGSVVVKLEGMPAITLRAGEKWTRDVPAERSSPAVASPPTAPSASASASVQAAPRPIAVGRPATVTSASPRASAAIDDGEEDRAYVEIVRLLREKRDGEATAAARDYVRRFPNGFRRTEVDRVLAGH